VNKEQAQQIGGKERVSFRVICTVLSQCKEFESGWSADSDFARVFNRISRKADYFSFVGVVVFGTCFVAICVLLYVWFYELPFNW
jgi:hypothetical protein